MNIKEVWLPFDAELLPSKILKPGMLTCLYEAGNLRYIKWGNTEIVRMIYSAVRDENWNTIPAVISGETIDEDENGFIIKYSAFYTGDAIRYRASFHIEGNKDGTIIFSMSGEALSDFKRNRIGLCMHHPIKECSGKEVTINRPDGSIYHSAFPALISPHQPFLNVRQMEWRAENGLQASIEFEGEVFETEDHRNWTDSSYKTYGTPLTLPYPVLVKPGEKTEQQITIHINGQRIKENETHLVNREEKIAFPKIGYCRSEKRDILSGEEITLLRQIPFDHYRVELRIREISWQEKLLLAAKEARLLRTKLELIVFFPEKYQPAVEEFVSLLEPVNEMVSSMLVLQENKKTTPESLLAAVYKIIKQKYPLIRTGYGTDAYFADLNRNRPSQAEYDFVSFSMNPQVHATDTGSLLENLENQSDLITTARSFTNKKIHVSPITLKKRGNPDATAVVNDISTMADKRQHSYFAAFWTLMAIQNFAEAGQITFYETSGEAGISQGNKTSPVYDVLKKLKGFKAINIIRKYAGNLLLMEDFTAENAHGDLIVFKFDPPSASG